MPEKRRQSHLSHFDFLCRCCLLRRTIKHDFMSVCVPACVCVFTRARACLRSCVRARLLAFACVILFLVSSQHSNK